MRTDEYFDLHVPGAEHYLADGIWHHNTGKSRAGLEKLHLCALKYDGMRGLIVRKTRQSLSQSALVTFERKVLPPDSDIALYQTDQEYPYPNGSVVVVAGLDKPSKVMSSDYDMIYVQEATELTEGDLESLTTRLRNGVMPYQQLTADCNPGPPTHWLKRRADRGGILLLDSRHEDNPVLWDRKAGDWTPAGRAYIAKLDALTGVRKDRLRHGRWAAAEGMVYDAWDEALHLVDHFDPPREWPHYWTVDFGYTNPFCWQDWVADPDGRIFLHRELYRTQGLVEDHARAILAASAGRPHPVAIVCDHDAEDRATLEKHVGLPTIGADKRVRAGIQAVQARLRPAGDGRPRLFVMRGALVERDPRRDDAKRPAATAEEFDTYVWTTPGPSGVERRADEVPLKKDDHGMDALRYMVMYLDGGEYDPNAADAWSEQLADLARPWR